MLGRCNVIFDRSISNWVLFNLHANSTISHRWRSICHLDKSPILVAQIPHLYPCSPLISQFLLATPPSIHMCPGSVLKLLDLWQPQKVLKYPRSSELASHLHWSDEIPDFFRTKKTRALRTGTVTSVTTLLPGEAALADLFGCKHGGIHHPKLMIQLEQHVDKWRT